MALNFTLTIYVRCIQLLGMKHNLIFYFYYIKIYLFFNHTIVYMDTPAPFPRRFFSQGIYHKNVVLPIFPLPFLWYDNLVTGGGFV